MDQREGNENGVMTHFDFKSNEAGAVSSAMPVSKSDRDVISER